MKKIAIKASKLLLCLVYAWVAVVLVLLFLTFFLELLAANPTAGFVEWVYRSTERAMAPFRGIFEPIVLDGESVIDVSVLFAMIVYTFIALALHSGINWLRRSLDQEERQEFREKAIEAQHAANTPTRVLQLASPAGLSATAVLQHSPYGTAVELTAVGLEPFQSYSAWLESADGMRVSTATFQPPAGGSVRLALATSMSLADSRRFGVTLLPAAGSTVSTDVLTAPLA